MALVLIAAARYSWLLNYTLLLLSNIFVPAYFLLLQERMEEMTKLVVKYLKDRYSARWKELTSKTAEHYMTSENI